MNGFFTTVAARRKQSFGLGWKPITTWALLACCALAVTPVPVLGRTLEVGPTRELTGPSDAAKVAMDGDRIVLDPGVYRDCAIWKVSRLTIEARTAPDTMKQTVMNQTFVTGPPCGDRGLFIFNGNDITVRGLIFAHARDSFHRGAGILMEGANLTVENSVFLDDENGILAGGPPSSVVRIRHTLFQGDGSCQGPCAHALYVGAPIARLEVVDCLFLNTHVGHDIKSRARATLVRDSRIEDGPDGNSSYLIELPDGGDAAIINNTLQKGPKTDNKEVAISIGTEDNGNPTRTLVIRGNRFANDLPEPVAFVRNLTRTPARLTGNTFTGRVVPLNGPGTVD
jgi:hypothetical protein